MDMREDVLSVSQFIEAINLVFEDFSGVVVEGEVDEFKIIHNKWVTFRLKDEHSSIGCFLPVWEYHTEIEDGMLVRAMGRPTLRDKGFFSFVVTHLQPTGEGALRRAFELLRKKLEGEGLFAPERKRPLPRFPQHIALITSRDAAAFTDFLKILRERQGGLAISFIHSLVQGTEAPHSIVAALEYANTELEQPDVIVLVRGGGSLEDLQAFNDERVVRVVAASRTPTIVGVGHERDVTLADLAADVRASTPSNAAELLVRSREEVALDVMRMVTTLQHYMATAIQERRSLIRDRVNLLKTRVTDTHDSVRHQIASLTGVQQRLTQAALYNQHQVRTLVQLIQQRIRARLHEASSALTHHARLLHSLSPQQTLGRGYSITRTAQGTLVRDSAAVALGDTMVTTLHRGSITSRITSQ